MIRRASILRTRNDATTSPSVTISPLISAFGRGAHHDRLKPHLRGLKLKVLNENLPLLTLIGFRV